MATISEPYYKYAPQPVTENETIKTYWNSPIFTEKTIVANIPL